MNDGRGEFLWPPHGTTLAAARWVVTNAENLTELFHCIWKKEDIP